MKKRKLRAIFLAIFGLVILFVGLILLKVLQEPQGILKVLPYFMVGIGCGIFGGNLGDYLNQRAIAKSPELAKTIEIEQNDERNITLACKAKAKAYDFMIYIFGAVIITFGLMQIELAALIILISAYLYVVFSGIYYRAQYEREM